MSNQWFVGEKCRKEGNVGIFLLVVGWRFVLFGGWVWLRKIVDSQQLFLDWRFGIDFVLSIVNVGMWLIGCSPFSWGWLLSLGLGLGLCNVCLIYIIS